MNKMTILFNLIFIAFLAKANGQNDARLVRKGDYFGFQNQKGDWLTEPKYELFDGPFSDFMVAQNDQKWGLLDQKGQPIVPFEFERAAWVDDSTVFFSRPGRQLALNPLGQKNLETNFDRAELLTQDFGGSRLFRVFKNEHGWGAVDFSGKQILPFEFSDIRPGGPRILSDEGANLVERIAN